MKISFIKHSDLSDYYKSKIIDLKNQHWKYSYDQHSEWLKNNLTENDYHLVISDEKNDVMAYLNLFNLKITKPNEVEELALGIGNVCVNKLKKKKGLGLLIINIVNYYLKNNFKQGVLLCNHSLVPFYEKAGWKIFKGEYFINHIKSQVSLMSFVPIEDETLLLNKNF